MQVPLKLSFYPETSEVEMWDVKKQRVFLRKTFVKGISQEMLYPGGKVTVMSRLLTIMDYGDAETRAALGKQAQKTLAMIKVSAPVPHPCPRPRAPPPPPRGAGRAPAVDRHRPSGPPGEPPAPRPAFTWRSAPAPRPPRSRTPCSIWGRSCR